MNEKQTKLRLLAWPAFKSRFNNPYSWLLYTAMGSLNAQVNEFSIKNLIYKNFDILHIHWPEVYLNKEGIIQAFLGSVKRLSLYFLAKMRGAKIVWTVHNTLPHNLYHPKLQKIFYSLLLKIVDGYIYLSEPSYDAATKIHPRLHELPSLIQKFGHGHYRDVYQNNLSRVDARKKMGIEDDKVVILFLGTITPYKNVISLCDSFTKIPNDSLQLIIAGKPSSDELEATLTEKSESDPRIDSVFQFIPEEDLQMYFNASDLVVLPFLNMTNSGSALCALSFNTPILTSHTGSMRALQDLFGEKWVKTYEGDFSVESLTRAIQEVRIEHQDNEVLDMSDLDWRQIADETMKFYLRLISK